MHVDMVTDEPNGRIMINSHTQLTTRLEKLLKCIQPLKGMDITIIWNLQTVQGESDEAMYSL